MTTLDLDVQAQGSHCTHCFKSVGETGIKTENDHLNATYCSTDCQAKSKAQSQNLLFGLEPPLPEELDNGLSVLTKDDRDKAETEYTSYLKSKGKTGPIVAARLAARAIAIETSKLASNTTGPSPADLHPISENDDNYALNDHLERLRFIDVTVDNEEHKLLRAVLATAVPGIEGSVADDRYAALLGKVAYNSYGVCFDGGRDDRVCILNTFSRFQKLTWRLQPTFIERPEDQERTRTPHGTSRQVGTAFYVVSSYVSFHNELPTICSLTIQLLDWTFLLSFR